ncbi:hypothetical protein [Propylenella binzhouense]|uniref:Uncharacterized protein n=1 Tax=Propylenella binzhouense TaxID=2555902 RepID=A0A964T6R5_9HYPH|nr:hypothetical protein [Propylenella binzhouense]MYZ48932.1 hypothetical protein [Propylenella binzhouense]
MAKREVYEGKGTLMTRDGGMHPGSYRLEAEHDPAAGLRGTRGHFAFEGPQPPGTEDVLRGPATLRLADGRETDVALRGLHEGRIEIVGAGPIGSESG